MLLRPSLSSSLLPLLLCLHAVQSAPYYEQTVESSGDDADLLVDGAGEPQPEETTEEAVYGNVGHTEMTPAEEQQMADLYAAQEQEKADCNCPEGEWIAPTTIETILENVTWTEVKPMTTIETHFAPRTRTVVHPWTGPTTMDVYYDEVTRTVVHPVTQPPRPIVWDGATTIETIVDKRPRYVIRPLMTKDGRYATGYHYVPRKTYYPAPQQEQAYFVPQQEQPQFVPQQEQAHFIAGQVRQCSCSEASACKAASFHEMNSCMEECEGELSIFGPSTHEYRSCFVEFPEHITEAEECLHQNDNQYCANGVQGSIVDAPEIDKYTGFEYQINPSPNVRQMDWLKKPVSYFSKFQRFNYCTRNCMHRKMMTCFQEKQCAVKMPAPNVFEAAMGQCIKHNHKVAFSMLRTCQCMAFNKGVKDLIGSCAVVGHSLFIDNV